MDKPKPLTVSQAAEAIKQQVLCSYSEYKEATAGFDDVLSSGDHVMEKIKIPLKGGGSIVISKMVLTFTPETKE